ncbi:MAG: N-acetyltransferase [Micavibrio aeruginosavorus]|uniref:N-acetyltransferase n=1 Tax=Micavibrio aeruginosavorus TaxID=349221 RepID=A0A2W5A5S2_9BACT|nr:MAG: N-acetyltransferase [Micavibrio aeruginosavorus]
MSTNVTTKKNPIMIDVPMPIETPRLILRNVMPGDGKATFEAKQESYEDLKKWMPWAKELGTEEDLEVVARKNYAEFILREDIMILGFEKATGKFVIGTGLHRMDWDAGYFEIGYWVRSSAHGQGYATESTNALLRYAFNALGAQKVGICHAGGNDASRRVIEKLGFIPRGVIEDNNILPTGERTSRHWFARYDLGGLPELKVKWG